MTPGRNPLILGALAMMLLCSGLISAQSSSEEKRTSHCEVMAVPAVLYNSLSAGYSFRKGGVEHVFNGSACYILTAYDNIRSVLYRYNRNYELFTGNRISTYLPVWTGVRYSAYSGHSERESAAFDLACISFGGGYGMKVNFRNDHKLRLELGAGVAVNAYLSQGRGFSAYPMYEMVNSPVMPSLHFTTRYMIPLKR